MEMSDQFHAPIALLPGKEPLYSLGRGLGGPDSRSASGVEQKKHLPLPGIEPRPSSK
jgi:hypothetical protein